MKVELGFVSPRCFRGVFSADILWGSIAGVRRHFQRRPVGRLLVVLACGVFVVRGAAAQTMCATKNQVIHQRCARVHCVMFSSYVVAVCPFVCRSCLGAHAQTK